MSVQSQSPLLRYRRDEFSQFGEDGIIERIFELIPDQNHWCVEFGAWDGKKFSNTHHLMRSRQWSGVFVEANPDRFQELQGTYAGNTGAHCVNTWVNFEGENSLDRVLSRTPIPKAFDLLSIDIDGADYHVWDSLKVYTPKVVVIEFNPFIPGNIDFVQAKDMSVMHGSSVRSLTRLGREKGYELVCINQANALFVRREYFHLFGITDNSIEALKHFREPLQVFQLYDGTLVFHGEQCVHYSGVKFDFNKHFQVLPKLVRDAHLPWATPSSKNLLARIVLKLWKLIYSNRSGAPESWAWMSTYPDAPVPGTSAHR